MDDKKTHNSFTPDAESEQNFWMMAQQRAAAPGYPGFYPMLRPIGGPPGINPIRHILPQIPTRASNPRTAVSKASLRDPFPGLARPDVFSNFITGDSLNREIIWRDECKAGGREVLDQVEMARINKLDLMPPGNEVVQDMSMASAKSSSKSKDDGDGFPADNDFHRDAQPPESEFLRKTEPVFETTQLVEVDDAEKPAASSVDIKISGNDDEKVFCEDASDGSSSFPVSSPKLKETTTSGNPIKLKIRCDFKEGHKELMAIIGNDSGNKRDGSSEATSAAAAATGSAVAVHQAPVQQSSPQQGLLTLAPPSSPQTVLHTAPVPSPSMSIVRPKTGRAKTNAELKKQLMEKRAVQYLKGQGDGGSQASSPATSHVDVSSPASLQADVPSPLSAQTESASTDALDSSYERSALSRNSQNGRGKRPGTLTTGVSDSDSPSLDTATPTETRWVVGDMLWARVSGHPWWPCIVSPDPFQQMYTKVITRGHKVSFRQYHVLFFGEEGERGWVQEATAIPFEGRTKFENFCDEMIKEQKKDKKNYTVAPNRRRAWEVAVTDAERARTMPRVRRIEEYVTVYDSVEPVVLSRKEIQKADKESSSSMAKASEDGATQNKSLSHAKQQPRKSLAEDPAAAAAAAAANRSVDSESPPPPRKKQRLTEPAAESPSHIKLPKNISNQHVIQYTVFCQKRRDSVKSKHPDYDDEQVESCLQEQWSKLDDETRSRFIPMGSDFTYLSQMMATVGMPKAPIGVKRSSRFVKTKKKPTLKKREKEKSKAPDIKEIVPDGDGKEKGISKEEKRTPRLRTSAEKKCMEVESPAPRKPSSSFSDKDAKIEKPSPVQSPLSVAAASTGIPPKKRGRKSKEVRASPVEIVEQKPPISSGELDQAKKVTTPAARKEMAPKSVVSVEDEDTEEELDDVYVCFICEKATKGIEQCQGLCQGRFHPSCLSQSSPVGGRFICDECSADNHKCFVCKSSDPKTVPCCVSECGRYYHKQCLGAFQPEGAAVTSDRPFTCPLHSCFTCQLKKPEKGSMNEVDADVTDLLMCVRCPMAYHMTDSCVSAGSLALTGKYIVCSRHFEPSKAHSLHTKTSSSWCFVCEKGGSVLCCDSCPAAYHAACLQISAIPSGAWQCPDCSHGKTPLYGDLVWVKFGSYRWWPAEIYHPASLPSNIQDLPHQVGEFPVCFFGSHDYLWLHRGRVFPFREGDKCCREADAKGTAKIFDKAMKEAIAVYRMLNPNVKPPTNSTGDRNLEKLGGEKKKNNHDPDASNMDNDDVDKGEGGGGDDDAESGVCSSLKASTSGDRRTRRAKVRPNSKVLRQLQRQSRALSLMETPRSSIDGRAPRMVNDHEAECYRCSRDGVLILCDKPRCPKAYHRKCINKMKLPHGIWLCPWHHCDTCGKAAIQFCSRCPNSYCADHVVNNIVFSYELGMVCSKHPDVKVDSLDTAAAFPLAYLDTSPPVPVQRAKETGEKKRRGKSAKEKPTPSSMDRRSAAAGAVARHKLTDLESGAENLKSDDGPIDKKAVLPAVRKGGGSEKKGDKRPRSSKLQKSSEAFHKTSDTGTPAVSSAAVQSDNPELVDLSALSSSASKNPASQLDSPMFDNSDDEFPQLVIDVPTL